MSLLTTKTIEGISNSSDMEDMNFKQIKLYFTNSVTKSQLHGLIKYLRAKQLFFYIFFY